MFRKNLTIVQEITVPAGQMAMDLYDIAVAAGLVVRGAEYAEGANKLVLTLAGKQQAYDLTAAAGRAAGLVITAP